MDIGMVLLGRLAIACSCDSTRSAPHWKRQRDPDNFGIVGRYFSKALSASFGARDDLGAGSKGHIAGYHEICPRPTEEEDGRIGFVTGLAAKNGKIGRRCGDGHTSRWYQ